MKQNFLIIDPQKDFCDKNRSLYVNNADTDMQRLSKYLYSNKENFEKIFITKDIHRKESIFHPTWFIDSDGKNPLPFTNMSISKKYGPYSKIIEYKIESNKEAKEYFVTKESNKEWTFYYLKTLKEHNIIHTIWPEHCIINTEGSEIVDCIKEVLELDNQIIRMYNDYRVHDNYIKYNIIPKGYNPRVESFSPFKTEVIDPDDENTELIKHILDDILNCDKLFVTGEALSHCVKKAVFDIKDYLKNDLSKMVFIKNCSSPVSGYEKEALDFLEEIESCNCKIIEV